MFFLQPIRNQLSLGQISSVYQRAALMLDTRESIISDVCREAQPFKSVQWDARTNTTLSLLHTGPGSLHEQMKSFVKFCSSRDVDCLPV